MSEQGTLSGVKKEIYNRMLKARRFQQYELLWLWKESKVTGTQCIEGILDLEKIIPIDGNIIRGDKDVKK